MKRSEFKNITDSIFSDLEQHTYDFWKAQSYTFIYEKVFNGLLVQVEVSLLELSETYIHVAATAFANCYAGIRLPWDPLRPITRSFIVMNMNNGQFGNKNK